MALRERRHPKPGQGIVRRVGWDSNEAGDRVFRAIIDFPNGPPALSYAVIWDPQPVEIIVAPEEKP